MGPSLCAVGETDAVGEAVLGVVCIFMFIPMSISMSIDSSSPCAIASDARRTAAEAARIAKCRMGLEWNREARLNQSADFGRYAW